MNVMYARNLSALAFADGFPPAAIVEECPKMGKTCVRKEKAEILKEEPERS